MEKGSIAFGISLTPKEDRFLREIEEFFGASNRSEAVRLAIELAYQSITQPDFFEVKGREDYEETTRT